MTKRTVVLSSATGMLLTMFSSIIDAQLPIRLATSSAVESVTFVPALRSQGNANTDATVYDTLLELSGFAEQLQRVPEAVARSIESAISADGSMEPFEPRDYPFLKQVVPAAFAGDVLHNAVVEQLQSKLSLDAAKELAVFYTSPLGERLRTAELENSVLENFERFNHWHKTQGVSSLSNERQVVLEELEKALLLTEGAVDAMIGMQVAMQVSMTPILPPEQRRNASDLMSDARRQRSGLTKHYLDNSLATLGFVFQQQSLDQLRSYTKLLNTEAGQLYVVAINDGLSRGLIYAAENLGNTFQKLLEGRIGQGA
ncbi:MAG: hypothetical protein AB8B79_11085 [Granulosicoccus sp.]